MTTSTKQTQPPSRRRRKPSPLFLSWVPSERLKLLKGKIVRIRDDQGKFLAWAIRQKSSEPPSDNTQRALYSQRSMWTVDSEKAIGSILPGAPLLFIDADVDFGLAIVLGQENFHQFRLSDLIIDETCPDYDLVLSLIPDFDLDVYC